MKHKQCPRPTFGILMIALLGAALTVSASLAQSTTYDRFQANRPIDPDKWQGLNFQNFDGATLETVREARGGKLVLSGRVVGGTVSDTAEHFAGVGLISTEPTEALQLELRVTGFAATACSTTGSSEGFVLVRTENHLFSDVDGDVLAFIDVTHSTTFGDLKKTLRVTGEVAHQAFGSPTVLDLGKVLVGEHLTIRIEWLPGADRVDFQRDNEPVQSIFYTFDDSVRGQNNWSVFLETAAPNCTAGRTSAEAGVQVDNILVD